MKMKGFYVPAALLPLLLTGCKGDAAEAAAPEYAVMTVKPASVEHVEKYPATIRGRHDVEVYPQLSGRITEVSVREGQHVRRGQTLFVIDQVPYKAALRTAQANLSVATAGVATAELTYRGKKELYDNQVTSLYELQKAENELLTARAQQEQAEAQLIDARNNLSYTVVSSPVDGVVGVIPYRAGTLVSSSSASPLTTVSDNSSMFVYFSMSENQMLSLLRRYGSVENTLAAMPDVSLYLNDGSEYGTKGRVETISGVLDAETGSVSLRAVFDNAGGLLHSGGAGNVGIVEQWDSVLTIPQSATYELQDKVYAYRLKGGKAVVTPISVERLDAQRLYVVTAGLREGDTIVTEGVSLLQDGQPITIKKEKK